MKIHKFPEVNVVFAKDQPEYRQLPAYKDLTDRYGQVVSCWRLSFRERLKVLFRGEIWVSILTFNNPLQPLKVEVDKPDIINPE